MSEEFTAPPQGFSLRIFFHSGSPLAFFYSQGEGRPIVFLHGFPDTPHLWLPVISRLEKGRRPFYLLWLRGYPPSGNPPGNDYTLYSLTHDLALFFVQLPGEPPDLVGHDWGGVLGYSLGALFPERIHRLVAISVPPAALYLNNLFKSRKQFYRSRYIAFFQLPVLPELSLKHSQYLTRLIREWSPHYPDELEVQMRLKYFQGSGGLGGALAYYRHLFFSGLFRNPSSYLRTLTSLGFKVKVPTLILTGDKDGGVGIEMFFRWEKYFVKEARFKVFQGCGHFLPAEEPEGVAKEIREFLAL